MSIQTFLTSLIILLSLALGGCTDSKQNPETNAEEGTVTMQESAVNNLRLVQANCASCHHLIPGKTGPVVAPPMSEIRAAYLATFPDKEAFIEAIVAFNKNPRVEGALMRDAVAEYGLMPKLGVDQSNLKAIAEYLYQYDVGSEQWQEKTHVQSGPDESDDGLSYAERGRKYALGTKQALGAKLLASVQEAGPAGAVGFCNIHALPITDSMSTKYGVSIKRVSDRPRNAANRANAEELAYIEALKMAKIKGEELAPFVMQQSDKVLAYFAIETNDMCLKCHGGKDSDIAPETWKVISHRYPDDKATGYGLNEIRGIFVVEMDK